MTGHEKQGTDAKQKIRDRYQGIDTSKLEIIPPKPLKAAGEGVIKRVAAYCRVSTESDEQTSSFELQKNYFTEYIQNQPGWVLVDVYADEGISGTSINHREGLQRLLNDCRAGKIDYIITKSISRFARNIVDCLTMIEELRRLKPPVGIIFESDHIDTLGGNDSLLLSIMASLAETESYNKSVIMNWSIENRFKRGIFLLPELIGYDKDENGNLVINDEEADTVRLCFYLYLAGAAAGDIAELLTELKCRSGYNKQRNKKPGVKPTYHTTWTGHSVQYILQNERHCGDVLARKTFTPNFKDHKSVKNVGQREQVRKRDDHEAIVSREVWEAVNRKRTSMYGRQHIPLPTLKVVDDGALRGFVPVNRNWAGFSSEDFRLASESAYHPSALSENDAAGAAESSAPASTLAGYHVVRAQMFSTWQSPALTISKGRLRFNVACLRRFEDVEYVELLFNSVEKCLAVRPCQADNPNAIRWGTLKEGKWTVIERSCRGFAGPLFERMAWNTELKYRLRGSYVSKGESRMMLFDLEEPEMVNRVQELPAEAPADIPTQPDEGKAEAEADSTQLESTSRPRYRKVVQFPESWYRSFGKSYEEDAQYLVRIHYAGNWDVFRPAREVAGMNAVTEEEIWMLFGEAQQIIEKMRKGA